MLVFSSAFLAKAKDHGDYLEFPYVIKGNDTFFSILKKVFQSDVQLAIDDEHVQNIILRNPQIKNWKLLPKDHIITIIAREDLINKEEMLANERLARQKQKDYLEEKTLKKIASYEKENIIKLYYNRMTYDVTEVLPESLESSFETIIGLGIEYQLHFNKDLYPLRFDFEARYNLYKNLNFISSTNPTRTFQEVEIPATWDYQILLAKEKIWNGIGLFIAGERSTLYNVEFSVNLDRNLLRTNNNIWFDVGLEYPIHFESLKFNLSTRLGRPLLIETYLTDLIGTNEFSDSENNLELTGVRQIFSGEVIYNDYYFFLSYINTKYSDEKSITFKEIKSRIGIRF